tara:strand:+ start:2576 stop:2764 length:189 start_codon:yes stop_codon:yes gene_type:complete
MSYCRFENTTRDMEDCVEQLRERTLDDLNEDELRSLGSFLDLAKEIVDNEYYIQEILDKGEQ